MATGGAAAVGGNPIVDALAKYQQAKHKINFYVSTNSWNSKKFETKKKELLDNEKIVTENLFSALTPETVNNLYEIEGNIISPLSLSLKNDDYNLAEQLVCGLDADIVGLSTDKLPKNTDFSGMPISILVDEYKFTVSPVYNRETGHNPSTRRKSIRSILACGLSTDKYYGIAKDILEKAFYDETYNYSAIISEILKIITEIRKHFGQKVGGARRRKTRRHHRNKRKSRKQR